MKKIEKLIKGKTFDRLQYFVAKKTPDFLIQWFDNWLETYSEELYECEHNQIVKLGFCDLRFSVENRIACLQAPDFQEFPLTWVNDLDPILPVVTRHQYIPQSYDLPFDIPSMNETAIISERFDELPVFLTRTEKDSDSNHSGWFITSLSDNGDITDEESLKIMSLHEAVVKSPRLISYLSMPEGTQIIFETSAPIIMYRNKVLKAGKNSFIKKSLAGGLIDSRSVAI